MQEIFHLCFMPFDPGKFLLLWYAESSDERITMDRFKSPLVWLDMEMTGLNSTVDVILEVALIITDNNGTLLAEPVSYVIHQEDAVLNRMDEWNQEQHAQSGLIKAVKKSSWSIEQVQQELYGVIIGHIKKGESPLCGNSVWQDRLFLRRFMPDIEVLLHYRNIDVSSVKELIRRWYAGDPQAEFKKPETHRALEDIQQSIAELKHYRTHFFR